MQFAKEGLPCWAEIPAFASHQPEEKSNNKTQRKVVMVYS
jgi:hypothetical protein